MSAIDIKDKELYDKKVEEYKETLDRIKTKREEYDKIYFNYDINGIKNKVDELIKKSEEIKKNIEEHDNKKNEIE